MRRLEGISYFSDGPVRAGFVELGDVTVLTGVNDSGKTRILGVIEAALSHPEWGDMVDVFGIAGAAEVEAFLDPDEEDQFDISQETDAIAELRDALVLPAREDGVRLGVRLPAMPERAMAWSYGRSRVQLSAQLRDAVDEALPMWPGEDPHAPVKLEYRGDVSPLILPEAMVVPVAPDKVQGEVGAAVMSLCRALRELSLYWARVEDRAGPLDGGPDTDWAPPLPAEQGTEENPSSSWLLDEEEPLTSVIHPAAIWAAEAFERVASRLLPDFISDVYRLHVSIASPSSVARGDWVLLELERLDSPPLIGDEELGGFRFPVADAASGYVVWLQLGLREAAARVSTCARVLLDGARRTGLIELEAGPDEIYGQTLEGFGIAEIKQILQETLASLRDPGLLPPETWFEPMPPHPPAGEREDDGLRLPEGWLSVFRSRLYLVDEPEQRLHPVLQRRAARWLAAAMSQWGSQCVLATHSVAFMDLPGDVHAYELSRPGEQATIARLDVSALTPQSLLAREMGLDRGELLSRWRAFLFVANLDGLAVLQELCGERLERSRVHVLFLDHHRQHAGLLDVTVLAQFTAVPLTALFVSIPEHDLQQLQTSSARDRAELATGSGETATGAGIMDIALQRERDIALVTLSVPDIFDLLDKNMIRQATPKGGERGPFPGHRAAREAYQTARQADTISYRDFLQLAYGVSASPAAIRQIAHHMRQHEIVSPQLEDLLWRIDHSALAAETG